MPDWKVGEGIVDVTPPEGVELAGFHRLPGQERRMTGVRDRCLSRALAIAQGDQTWYWVAIDLCTISDAQTDQVRKRASQSLNVPESRVQVAVSHSHSTPTGVFLRQWGAVPEDYLEDLVDLSVSAMTQARDDLAEADLYCGTATVQGGNYNRTDTQAQTEDAFGPDASEAQRWLDRTLHVLHFLRTRPKSDILWYHFAAHPVCFTDTLAGPDWVGLVRRAVRHQRGLDPGFLQGHCGDVNPGDGSTFLGVPEDVAEAITSGVQHAIDHAERVEVDAIRTTQATVELPLDLAQLAEQLQQYRDDPAIAEQGGVWVDPPFAQDWFEDMQRWPEDRTARAIALSAMALGPVAVLFHPAELYSYYGLRIRHASPFAHTLAVGYANDMIGYLTDPRAHEVQEYAAAVVPKILGLPPFQPEAARVMTDAAVGLLGELAGDRKGNEEG